MNEKRGPVATDAADEALALRLRQGDPMAFCLLVQRYKNPIVNFAFRMTQDAHLAEDVAQEVFLAMHRSGPGWREEAKFSTWLFTIANSRCIDALRRRKKEQRVEAGVRSRESVRASHPDPAPDDPVPGGLIREEIAGRVRAAVAQLEEPYRQAIVLREYHGFTPPEIAEITGAPVATVKSWLHRARLMLKDHLKPVLEQFA